MQFMRRKLGYFGGELKGPVPGVLEDRLFNPMCVYEREAKVHLFVESWMCVWSESKDSRKPCFFGKHMVFWQ